MRGILTEHYSDKSVNI